MSGSTDNPTSPPTPSDAELVRRYPEVDAFARLMRIELWANRTKGDQAGWRAASVGDLWNEIQWHAAKLAMAIRERDQQLIREYTADVANMSLMLADVAGVLPVAGSTEPATDRITEDDIIRWSDEWSQIGGRDSGAATWAEHMARRVSGVQDDQPGDTE